ncbi:MAG: type IX secretion system sortase PorU [Bacteroidota bacterium]
MKSILKYYTILLAVAILSGIAGSVSIAKGAAKDIFVIESSAKNLIVEFKPKYLQQREIASHKGNFTEMVVENSDVSNISFDGSPKLLERKIYFAIPSLMKPSFEILTLDYEDIAGMNLVPIPTWEKKEELPFPKYEASLQYYSQNIFLPENIVTIDEPQIIGGCAVSSLKISPYQFNPSTKTFRKFSRIVLKINFPEMKIIAGGNPVAQSLSDVILNYNVARDWKMIPQNKSTAVRTNSVLTSGNWWATDIANEGMYKITGAVLSQNGIPRNTVQTIKIYNNGGFEIPDNPSLVNDNGDLKENAIYVVDKNSNGNFEDDDYIIFFGKGVNGWKYNASTKSFSHTIHHYAEKNMYFLSYNEKPGKRMSALPSLDNLSAVIIGNVSGKIFREEEKINGLQSGRQWLGELFNSGDEFTTNLELPGLIQGTFVQYRFSLAARADDPSTFKVFEHSNQLLTAILPAVNTSNVYGDFCSIQTFSAPSLVEFSDDQSALNFAFTTSSGGSGYLDWIEIFYSREVKAKNDFLHFHSLDTTGILEYSASNFSSNEISSFDISDLENVKKISSLSINNNTIQFRTQVNAGAPNEIILCGASGYKSISTLRKIANQNLHGDTNGVRNVIVTHPELLEQATRLGKYRQFTAKRTLKTKVVTLQQIYNEFSSGVPDVGAVRNYAKYLFEAADTTERLKYLLLFGDGDFDFKRIISSGPNWVPPWETENSFGDPIESFAGDDFFGSYSVPFKLDVSVGRLCVRSAQDAENAVDKIIEYETNPVRDGWNNKIIYVADDFQEEGTLHNDQADDLAQYKTPSLFEKIKLYSAEFQAIGTSLGRRKPSMNEAIINEWNRGALIINYTGHGNPRVWTHEQVFTRESTIPKINNKGKYPFLVAATCNFAQFDNLGTQSSAEILSNKKASGVIAVFAATRAVYAFSNAQLNQNVYEELFITESSGRIIPKRLGDVTRLAKLKMWGDDNQRRFYLLGDPAVEIAIPREYAVIDSINNQLVSVANKQILTALSKPVIHSKIIDSTSNVQANFFGNGYLTVFDAYRDVTIKELVETSWYSYTYRKTGSSLYRGSISLVNGTATTHFIVPKDIMYDTSYNARVGLFFWNNETDGSGVTELVRIGGTDSTAVNDVVGPTVFAYLNKQSFRSGDVVTENSILYIELSDSSGINTSGAGIGHKLEARLDNSPQSIDLSSFYRSEINDFRRGKVEYRLSAITPGEHQLFIRAWDTYNNATEISFEFRVESNAQLSLQDVYNYPNPFSKDTYFTFLHNQTSPIDVEVKIFTVSGRIIQTLKNYNINDSFVRVHWNGHDYDGNEIANGLYLYKIIAKTTDKKFTSESLGKLSIIR